MGGKLERCDVDFPPVRVSSQTNTGIANEPTNYRVRSQIGAHEVWCLCGEKSKWYVQRWQVAKFPEPISFRE